MTGHDPDAARASLGARLANHAREIGYDVNRLRRHLVFQRILARLAPSDRWVLKGGFALEVRLPSRARATKDLDLTMLGPASALLDEFADALAVDVAADGFEFEIRRAREIAPADEQNDAVRFSVRARLGGREFASVVIDAAARPEELDAAVGPIVVPPPVLAPGIEPVTIAAVDIAQHAAEKFHALARRYADDRPSTRVKDLVDLILMLDTDLLPDDRLGERLRAVYEARDARAVPPVLPDPPAAWRVGYTAMATELGLGSIDLDDAVVRARQLYDDAVRAVGRAGDVGALDYGGGS